MFLETIFEKRFDIGLKQFFFATGMIIGIAIATG